MPLKVDTFFLSREGGMTDDGNLKRILGIQKKRQGITRRKEMYSQRTYETDVSAGIPLHATDSIKKSRATQTNGLHCSSHQSQNFVVYPKPPSVSGFIALIISFLGQSECLRMRPQGITYAPLF